MKDELVRFGVAMPESLLEEFDRWVAELGMQNRSLAIRHLVRDYISANRWHYGGGVACGSITILYDHHRNEVSAELTAMQHDFGDVIMCTTHVHMSHDMCLECVIVRGDVDRLKALETALKGIKGILSVNAGISGN